MHTYIHACTVEFIIRMNMLLLIYRLSNGFGKTHSLRLYLPPYERLRNSEKYKERR